LLALASATALMGLDSHDAEHVGLALPPLIAALSHEDDADMQLQSLTALAELGPAGKQALADLTRLLDSSNSDVRDAAAFALGKIGPDAKAAVPGLRELLHSPDQEEMTVAAYAL